MRTENKVIAGVLIFVALGVAGTPVAAVTWHTYTPIDDVTITSPGDGDVVFAGGDYPATCTTSRDRDYCTDGGSREYYWDGVAHNWSGDGSFDPTAGVSVTWTAPCADGNATLTVTASDNGSPYYANDTDKSDSVTVVVQSIIYVDTDATGNNDGTSWTDAFTGLQSALDVASSCSEIWVAEGTYKPGDASGFIGTNGANIYGGFDGAETARSQRDWTDHETILSGNIGDQGSSSDDAESVLTLSGGTSSVIDGFTITEGRGGDPSSGGGIVGAATGLTVSHCVLIDNSATNGFGGGIVLTVDANVNNCAFVDNTALWGGGLAVVCTTCNPAIINCTFTQNHATDTGGGVEVDLGAMTVTNCILWDDSAVTDGNEVYTWGGTATVTYCDVEDGYTGTCNINCDPDFVDDTDPDGNDDQFMTSDDGLMLDAGSCCIDAGNGNVAPPKDILDNSRYNDTTTDPECGDTDYVDIGAYEYQG
ncbi:MAG: hypothetical protein ACYTEL_07545 [Planctomycetota bacterium]|jgi:hypothetical protein